MKAIYKHLAFGSEDEFNLWLEKTAKYTLHFVDFGQDLMKIWVAENGEIIHCNLQASIWNGTFVDLGRAEEGYAIYMNNQHLKKWTEMDFVIERIIKHS